MAGTSTQAMDILRRLNPITASPSSAIETAALLDSFGYSLMPRTSVHQGMAAGLATLMGRGVGVGVERATDVLVSPTRPLQARLAATGKAEQEGEWFTVALPADDVGTAVPDLVADLVALGARVHAVEPGRISLEERLLGILREGADSRSAAALSEADR